jgi:ubiquitin C-terminal hydrolase
MENIDPSIVDAWIQGIDDDVERISSSPKPGSLWYIVSMNWLNEWRSKYGLKTGDMELDDNLASSDADTAMDIDSKIIKSNDLNLDQNSSEPNNEENPIPGVLPNDLSAPEEEKPLNDTLTQSQTSQIIDDIGPVNNEDILDINPNHEPNCIIKKGFRLGHEYEIIPPKAWNYFKTKYGAIHEIPRYSILLSKFETKVEISLKPIRVILLLNNNISPEVIIFHVSIKKTLKELEEIIKNAFQKKISSLDETKKIILWKCNQGINEHNINNKINFIKKVLPGVLLKGDDEVQNLEIADEDLVIAEIVDFSQQSFYKSSSKLTLESTLSDKSRKGLTGLQNLGNTCFMNSGLQCLSNTHDLTKFILSNEYKSKINSKNRIGSGGRIIAAYAELIKEMWNGTSSSVSPWNLKKALGSFASQFIGYSQQDSQEMLSFLIDGIHEDLNQAPKSKPTDIDENGLSEKEIADKYWEKHLERNQSIIVDLMHGQYRSEVTCLECKSNSVAFDPFLMLNLPVPSKERTLKEISVVSGNTLTQVKLEVPCQAKIKDILKLIPGDLKSESFIVGETDGLSKEVKRVISKGEAIESKKDYIIFNHPPLEDDTALALCNFSTKTHRDHYYGSGTSLGLTKLFQIKKSNLEDLHLYIYKTLIETIEKKELSNEELLNRFNSAFPSDKKEDILYSLNAYNPGRYPCMVCSKEACYGCKVPYSKDSLESLQARCNSPILFFNIVFSGDKNKFITQSPFINYEKNFVQEELNKRNNEKNGLDIYDCLKSFEEVEELDDHNTIYCRKCKKHVKGTKKMDIYKLPKYLIIHLKRFKRSGYSSQKNTAQINFPINDFTVQACNGERVSYDLYAVSNHYGSMGGGHYTAYAKSINEIWYDFNDSSASALRDKSSITSAAAYVLFYKRSLL